MKKRLITSIALAGIISSATASHVQASAPLYIVKKGDNLSKIATHNKVTVAQLKTWNHLKSTLIFSGQKMYVKNPGITVSSTSTTLTKYTVKRGDTLYAISKKYDVSLTALTSLNKLTSSSIIIGQIILVPSNGTVKNDQQVIASDNSMNSQPKVSVLAKTYTVRPGNTLTYIASLFKQSISSIKSLNGLKSDALYVGQTLKVTAGSLPEPVAVKDGMFPLKKGSYKSYLDTWGSSRTYGGERSHEGTDIMSAKGTPIYSVADGVIERYGWNTLGGWRLTIRAKDGYRVYYAHLDRYAKGIKLGLSVRKGDYLGNVGNTGYGTVGTSGKFESHLHLGVYDKNFNAVNPYPFLKYWENN